MAGSLILDFDQRIFSRADVQYRMLQHLGTGGNAETYLMLATNRGNQGVPFAVKVFTKIRDPERQDRFMREAKFLRSCDHPAIMRLFDEGVCLDKYPFVVAEYLPRTLRDVMRGSPTLIVEKLSYTLQLLSALAFLTRLKSPVVHRDIKPENIFVKGRSCVLGDFGLMKRLNADTEEDATVAILESTKPAMPLRYRTPDLVAYARGEVSLSSTKTDIFQLGIVLAELFTGRNPQRRAKKRDKLSEVVMDPLESVSGFLADGIMDLIQAMLKTNSDNRPSAEELLAMWEGLFWEAAERMNALEGRVF